MLGSTSPSSVIACLVVTSMMTRPAQPQAREQEEEEQEEEEEERDTAVAAVAKGPKAARPQSGGGGQCL